MFDNLGLRLLLFLWRLVLFGNGFLRLLLMCSLLNDLRFLDVLMDCEIFRGGLLHRRRHLILALLSFVNFSHFWLSSINFLIFGWLLILILIIFSVGLRICLLLLLL